MIFITLLSIVLITASIYFVFFKSVKKSLKGKHVMISGGSSGIGLSAAKEVFLQGANVTLLARDANKLKQAKDHLLSDLHPTFQDHGKVQFFSADVSGSKASLMEVVQAAEYTFGSVYMLINCAGFSRAAKFEDISESTLKGMMNVNFMGSFFLSQVVVQSMKQGENGGAVVFVSSIGGLLGIYGYTAYAASKAALIKMAEALHMESLSVPRCNDTIKRADFIEVVKIHGINNAEIVNMFEDCIINANNLDPASILEKKKTELKPHNISVTVCYPPDTYTPGFLEENKTKPTETMLISAATDIFEPDEVAKVLVEDALWGKFCSFVGLEGFLVATLCAGMAPITNIFAFLSQVFFSGLFRIISAFHLWNFDRIVQKELDRKRLGKRVE